MYRSVQFSISHFGALLGIRLIPSLIGNVVYLIRPSGLGVEISSVYDQTYIPTLCRRNTTHHTTTPASNLPSLHFDYTLTEEATVSK
jgi:hypothetical protein